MVPTLYIKFTMKKTNLLNSLHEQILHTGRVEKLTNSSRDSNETKKVKFFSITKAFRAQLLSEAMVSLGNSFELPALFKHLGWRIISSAFAGRKVKLASRVRILSNFGIHILRLVRVHGMTFTVVYLKSCQLAVQKSIAGQPLSSLKEIGGNLPFPRLDSRGLPRIIPVYDRALIKAGSSSIIRYWLTLFSVYRVIKIPGVLKLGTITDVCTANPKDLKEIGSKLSVLSASLKASFPKINGSDANLLFIEKASPSSRTS